MTFDPALDEAFRTVGRGIAAARIAEGEIPDPSTLDIAPEVAPLTDAQRARMIEALGRQLQRDVATRGGGWSGGGIAPRMTRH